MAVESDADRLAFLDPDDFGVAAIYTRGGVSTTVNGIFAAPDVAETLGAVEFSGIAPLFLMRAVDLPNGGAQGDLIAIGAVTYRVKNLRPDGTGMLRVELSL